MHIRADPVKHKGKLGDALMDIYAQVYSILETEKKFEEAKAVVYDQ